MEATPDILSRLSLIKQAARRYREAERVLRPLRSFDGGYWNAVAEVDEARRELDELLGLEDEE